MSDQAGTLSGSEVVRRISAELAGNPSWKIIVRGNSWLCPYCGEIAARDLTSGEAIEGRIARHLIEDCYGFENFTGQVMPLDELRRTSERHPLSRRHTEVLFGGGGGGGGPHEVIPWHRVKAFQQVALACSATG